MCKTIKLKAHFKAEPSTVYELLTDPKLHRAFSGKPASIERKPGGRFSTFAGRVSGISIDLLPGKRIVQAWRDRSFPEGIFSMATFNLMRTKRGETELILTHRGVPKALIPRIETEWRKLYWERMKAYLASKDHSAWRTQARYPRRLAKLMV